jgi:hypothetical protein
MLDWTQGVCNHGDKTSNDAEALNRMLWSLRNADDLFGSMLACATFQHSRTEALLDELQKVWQECGGSGSVGGKEWPVEAALPILEAEHQKLRESAALLAPPVPVSSSLAQADEFMVDSASGGIVGGTSFGAGFQWRVKISAMARGDYEGACGCGRVASTSTDCKHRKRVLMACLVSWRDKVKRWQTPANWERQVGKPPPAASTCRLTPPPPAASTCRLTHVPGGQALGKHQRTGDLGRHPGAPEGWQAEDVAAAQP